METYDRKSIFSEIKKYDPTAKEHSFIEITEWNNKDGVDINVNNYSDRMISLTYTEFELIKKMIKQFKK